MPKKLILHGFGFAVSVAIYITLVAWGLTNAERWFGDQNPGLWGPALFLMLFCLSAATVGALLFGRPVYLALSGDKKAALWQAAANIGWLLVFTILAFMIFAFIKA